MKKILICLLTFFHLFTLYAQQTHRVVKGDTLFSLSLHYEVPVDVLMEANHLNDPAALSVGVELIIPQTYEVRPGDTYYGIAQRNGVTVAELLAVNNRTSDDILLVGERILVPRSVEEVPEVTVQDDSDNAEKTVPQGPSEAPSQHFWPHPGERLQLTGKLQGESFLGQQGDKVYSVSSGEVVWVAPYRGYNKLIIVEAPDKHLFAYGGNDACFVSVGDKVYPGMELGVLGLNPRFGSARAFFFVYKDGEPVDASQAPRT